MNNLFRRAALPLLAFNGLTVACHGGAKSSDISWSDGSASSPDGDAGDAGASGKSDGVDAASSPDAGASGSGMDAGSSKPTSDASSSTLGPFDKLYNVESVSISGDYVVIQTKDLPDHKSPFYSTASGKYEAYNGTNASFSTTIVLMGQAMANAIAEQNLTFRIPKNPQKAATHRATSGGPIGVALNGVAIFNQYNGVGALLDTLEFNNMDQYNGHPTPAPSSQYHYHLEPLWLTSKYGSSALLGWLLDGFPVYGPVENGKRLKTADLDTYHGHEHATEDYPNGIYHYHVTDDAPWINGDGYWGTPGTVTR